MSETLLETAQNPTEAVTSTATATETATAVTATAETQQQTTSTEQPAAAAETAQATETAHATGAPEKYEFTAPEGKAYDPQVLTAFEGAARAANLPQDAAQKMVDAMLPVLAARQTEQVAAIHKEWADTVLADAEIGGAVGSDQFKQKMGVAKKFVTAFDQDGAFGKLLEDTGLGNHPAVLRVLYRAGKAISEDTFVGRGRGGSEGAAPSPLDVLYPTNKKD